MDSKGAISRHKAVINLRSNKAAITAAILARRVATRLRSRDINLRSPPKDLTRAEAMAVSPCGPARLRPGRLRQRQTSPLPRLSRSRLRMKDCRSEVTGRNLGSSPSGAPWSRRLNGAGRSQNAGCGFETRPLATSSGRPTGQDTAAFTWRSDRLAGRKRPV